MRDIPKFDSREIGQNLRSLMKQHDMTVKDLQKILGLLSANNLPLVER